MCNYHDCCNLDCSKCIYKENCEYVKTISPNLIMTTNKENNSENKK